MERKILVAIGNTELDNVTIKYLGNLFQGRHDITFDLFSVIPIQGVTASQQLLGDSNSIAISHPSALRKKAVAVRHLSALKKELLNSGFTEEQVHCDTSISMTSVAVTLLQNGQSGLYDAIILAKRDISGLQKMLATSISTILWQKDHSIPLWIVSGEPAGQHFLVPVDCSRHTLSALDHLGFMLQGSDNADITLFHSCSLLADKHITPIEDFYDKWGKEWCDEHLKKDKDGHFHFHAAKQILKENNIPIEHIHCIQQQSGIEPAQVITREMKKHTYSTIVMGRRLDKEKNIFKGVSDRVLANINNAALWVVG